VARRFFIDIETLPPDELVRDRVIEEAARELRAECIEADAQELARIADQRFRDLALRPEHGRILTVGLIVEDGDRVIHQGVLGRDRETGRFHLDEARTLRSFWNLLKDFNPGHDLLVGHNILDFDLQFLCKRSVVCRVRPSFDVCFARFRQRPVYDTMWEWNRWRKCISLHELAEALGIESPKTEGMDGGQVYDAFRDGRHDEIALYCMRDVECAREVYYRLNFLEPPPMKKYGSDVVTLTPQAADGMPASLAVQRYDLSVA
jgi:3'-5' exonuclease